MVVLTGPYLRIISSIYVICNGSHICLQEMHPLWFKSNLRKVITLVIKFGSMKDGQEYTISIIMPHILFGLGTSLSLVNYPR
jgi:hypothetical protein